MVHLTLARLLATAEKLAKDVAPTCVVDTTGRVYGALEVSLARRIRPNRGGENNLAQADAIGQARWHASIVVIEEVGGTDLEAIRDCLLAGVKVVCGLDNRLKKESLFALSSQSTCFRFI